MNDAERIKALEQKVALLEAWSAKMAEWHNELVVNSIHQVHLAEDVSFDANKGFLGILVP